MIAAELAALSRELKARAEFLEEGDWTTIPQPSAEGAAGTAQALAALSLEVSACRKCPLGSQRIKAVFGVGSASAQVVFVGEGPGYEEDRRGEPFVGKAGQLLDKILLSVGLSRETVYIANIVKCHPMADPSQPELRGNDRPPTAEEAAACRSYLESQLALIRPRAVVALGGSAAKTLLGVEDAIGSLRGRWHEFNGIPLLATYHPAALLRDESLKRAVWEDMKMLKSTLENQSL